MVNAEGRVRGVIDYNIIEKIQKLRAITERRGATEGEAIAAEQRMFRLLAKYNLEISQIPDDEPTKRDTRIESESAQRPSSVWKQHIYTGVANLNFSECFHLAPAHRRSAPDARKWSDRCC